MSKNDTLDKIDAAIKKIQNEEFSNAEVIEEKNIVKEETDTKIFNGDVDVSDNLEVTREFKGVSLETKKIDEVKISEEVVVTKKSNVGIYVGYFISLIIVVILVSIFILFLYN